MSKAIYSLKIFLFRFQFKLTARQKKGFAEFNAFVVVYYIKVWFECPISVNAARLDLQFINDMIDFIEKDKKLATAIVSKFSGHLWYLSEECMGMAFFDKNISSYEKRKMVSNLRITENKSDNSEQSSEAEDFGDEENVVLRPVPEAEPELGASSSSNQWDEGFEMMDDTDIDLDSESSEDYDSEHSEEESSRNSDEIYVSCERRVKVTPTEIIKTFKDKHISDFVTEKTFQFFHRFQISTEFLSHDPQTWPSNESWISGCDIVKKLRVTNDTAERGVKLIIDFLNLLSKNEQETQYLYQVVSQSRKEFPSHNIKDLVKDPTK